MSRFVTAPTERFLRRIEELRSLPAEMRQHIAARAADDIRPVVGGRVAEAVPKLRRRAQDQRWRLISQGISAVRHECFGAVMLSEQWAVARMAMADDRSPIEQILGERRLRAIEAFLQDNLPDGTAATGSIAATEAVAADAAQPENETTTPARANGGTDDGKAELGPVNAGSGWRPDNRAGRPS